MSVSADQKGQSVLGTILAVVVVFLIAIGVWYYVQGNNGSVKAAWSSIKESSEDTATSTKVKTALMLSKHVSPFDIDVSTKQGAVSLTGQVPSEEVKAMAGMKRPETRTMNSAMTVSTQAVGIGRKWVRATMGITDSAATQAKARNFPTRSVKLPIQGAETRVAPPPAR